MKFSKRLFVLMAVPTAVLVAAAAVGVLALRGVEDRFTEVFEREQPLAQSLTEMYGHGLQMGQALRNILLDPSNPTAYKNLDSASQAYEQASQSARRLAAGTPVAPMLEKVEAARVRQQAARARVLELAKTDTAGAVAMLNQAETPAWREMRSGLMEAGAWAGTRLKSTRDQALGETHRAVLISAAAALAGTAAAFVFALLLRRTLMRTLGGEPEAARELVQAMAAGDLTRELPLRPGDNNSLLAHMATMRVSLAEIIRGLGQAATHVSQASREIASGNADLSARTEQQAASLEQTAASMEEMNAQLKQSADASRQASTLASDASSVATKGGQVVEDVVATMDAISGSSRKIAEIIGVIDGIAFQTNILALNAAVEAARAGEQGRGFAVVAAEVRGLAQRSARAAQEVKLLIGDSVDKVEAGNRLVHEAGTTMQDLVGRVRRVTELVNEITHSTVEESSGIGQVNQAVAHLDRMTQQNAAMVEQSAAATQSLSDQAQRLQAAVGTFRLAPEPA